jgi:hypothetical protein
VHGLSVNVGKTLDYDKIIVPNSNREDSKVIDQEMRKECDGGAIWIPSQMLEIEPFQPVRGQLCGQHTREMIRIANRNPSTNLRLIVEEGLDILQVNVQGSLVSPDPPCSFVLQH